jgi:tetratricopeptide (TPR) repeat protein
MKGLRSSILLLALLPAALVAQQVTVASSAPQRLRVTTTNDEAARQFWAGLTDARNIFFSRATGHFDRAATLDGNFGLARVMHGWATPDLTTDQRKAEIDRGIASMSSASTGEMVTALALREFVAGNRRQARELFGTASELLPGDPNIAFFTAFAQDGPATGIPALRAVIERFPDDAPSYNILAYNLWQTGDRDGAITAVKKYVELAPDQPNSHDSYAELLQWEGRFSDAQTHYARAVQLDSSFSEAYIGSAEVLQLSGRGAEARRQIQQAITHSPSKVIAVGYSRDLARSFLMDGLVKEGMDQFATALRDAQTLNRPKLIAQIHQDMALADAQSGRGTAIASHLAAAAQAVGADDPMQVELTAAAYTVGGDINVARQAIQKFAALAQPDNQYATRASVMRAIIALRENKPTEALTQLVGTPLDDPWVRTLTAECYMAAGNLADARALKNQVLNDPQLNFDDGYNIAARIRAAKIKA